MGKRQVERLMSSANRRNQEGSLAGRHHRTDGPLHASAQRSTSLLIPAVRNRHESLDLSFTHSSLMIEGVTNLFFMNGTHYCLGNCIFFPDVKDIYLPESSYISATPLFVPPARFMGKRSWIERMRENP